MSIKLMAAIWENGPDKQAERFVLLALADFANDAGECWPSIASIAAKTCLSERGVRQIIRALEADGWLATRVGGGRGGASVYTINPERGAPINAPKPGTSCPPEPRAPRNETTETRHLTAQNPERGAPEPSGTIKNHQSDARVQRFDEFWEAYPHRGGTKKGRKPAFEKYRTAVKRGISEQAIIDGAKRSVSDPTVKGGFARDPATWLNQEGWTDEIPTSPATSPAKGQSDRDAKLARYAKIAGGTP